MRQPEVPPERLEARRQYYARKDYEVALERTVTLREQITEQLKGLPADDLEFLLRMVERLRAGNERLAAFEGMRGEVWAADTDTRSKS